MTAEWSGAIWKHGMFLFGQADRTISGLSKRSLLVTIVDACLRDGGGGSPTAVLLDDCSLEDHARRRVASVTGTSHAAFVTVGGPGRVGVRFFTAAGELPACGHGTVAALAFLATHVDERVLRTELRTVEQSLMGKALSHSDGIDVSFDAEAADVRTANDAERDLVLGALGAESGVEANGIYAASLGRERLLVPIGSRAALAGLTPDLDRLREGCDRLGLLGCYVYSVPSPTGHLSARMFAPSIGAPEDIANANSTACLVALLVREGVGKITVDMGDSLGSPATITASTEPDRAGAPVRVGGVAKIAATLTVSTSELQGGE